MATQLQIRRGTSAQVAAFTGAEGEIVVNTTNDSVHVNDGSTAGGFEMARVDGSNWAITNAISTTANISFGDNDKAIFGAGSDLQIYHDGSNSYIAEAGTGDLRIRGANVEIQTGGGNKYFQGSANVARLYHTNNEKLATSGAGIAVTGTVVSDGATIAGTLELNSNSFNHTALTPSYNFIESDVTGENTQFLQASGTLRIRTVDDSGSNVAERLRVDHSTGDISFYNNSGTSQSLHWDASTERLGLGTSAPARTLDVRSGTTDIVANFESSDSGAFIALQDSATSSATAVMIGANGDDLRFDAGDVERLRVTSSGRVGIGLSNPLGQLHINTETAEATTVYVDGEASRPKSIQIRHFDASEVSGAGRNLFYLKTPAADRLDIGNFSDGSAETQLMTFLESGSVGIGTNSPTSAYSEPALHIHAAVNGAEIHLTDGSTGATATDGLSVFQYGTDGYIWERESGDLRFGTAATERMRISGGNLLVGKTTTAIATAGTFIGGGSNVGLVEITRDGNAPLRLNRTSDDGDIAQFRYDGATVGRLSNNNTYFFIAGGASGGTHSGLRFVNSSSIRPCTSGGSNSNNVVAFGATSARWTVIYATTGTINTSDRREKQDIEALSDAEQRVAVAAKGLLRKFRWIDAVEAKGDDARIHFGIIAQDLQDAFTAEGLDAGRYAMFCSDTFWIDTEGESYETQEEAPEGATEQTRLGVRYSELLAFIISAI